MKLKSWHRKATQSRPARAFIWNETFQDGYLVLWGATSATRFGEISAACGGLTKKHRKWMGELEQGSYTQAKGRHFLTFRDKKPSPGIIAHEALHFVNSLMDGRGVKSDPDNDETHAYLLWWVVDKIFNLTRRGKLT